MPDLLNLGRPAHRVIASPFRLAPDGTVATAAQDTATADGELLAALIRTVAGERHLQPGFGITDPAGVGIDPAEVAAGVAQFGPPVAIVAVNARPLDETTALVEILFD